MHVELTKVRGRIGFGEASAYVGDQVACIGSLMFAIQ